MPASAAASPLQTSSSRRSRRRLKHLCRPPERALYFRLIPTQPAYWKNVALIAAVVSVETVILSILLTAKPICPPTQYPFVEPSLPASICSRFVERIALTARRSCHC